MNIAFVHYHLRRGGVSRVMAMAARALAERRARVVVLVGEEPPDPHGLEGTGASIAVVPGLGYADPSTDRTGDEPAGAALARALRDAARQRLGGSPDSGSPDSRSPDIWHVHNHALGKNAALPAAVHVLAADGEALLLQIHDFAEDGRPRNYRLLEERLGAAAENSFAERLYPLSPRVHYAALNRRDREFLAAAGAPPGQLHLLANPVDTGPDEGGRDGTLPPPPRGGEELLLYPTRAIRRKNLGELLLWSAIAEDGRRFATTLAPESPRELGVYDRWQAFAGELGLPVDFAIGADGSRSFRDVVAPASALVTTSIAEGFGLAFLEPWVLGRPLLGRDLPEITADFTAAGVDLGTLYAHVPVPADWCDTAALRAELDHALPATWAAYGREAPPDATSRALTGGHDSAEGTLDFGRLDEPRQEAVIRRARASRSAASELGALAPPGATDSARVERNAAKVRTGFGLEAYGERLVSIYAALAGSPRASLAHLDSEVLLDSFLAPERFRLLRT